MNKYAELTRRESQIAERIAWGASIKEVAYALQIKIKTVDNVIQRVYKKVGCSKSTSFPHGGSARTSISHLTFLQWQDQ